MVPAWSHSVLIISIATAQRIAIENDIKTFEINNSQEFSWSQTPLIICMACFMN
jgi:hypothetical protein